GDEVFDVGLNRAVTLIAEKIAKGPGRGRFGADPGKQLGDHPNLGAVAVKNGRYGAYVTAGGINATIPSDKDKDSITLAEAIALMEERGAKEGKTGKKAKKAKAEKPSEADAAAPKPAKKAAVKKVASKPKSDAVSKARAPVPSTAKTTAAKPSAAAKAPAKKRAGKASG